MWVIEYISQNIKWTSDLQTKDLNIGVFMERPHASWTLNLKKKKKKKDKNETLSPLINSDMLWKGKASRKNFPSRKNFFKA